MGIVSILKYVAALRLVFVNGKFCERRIQQYFNRTEQNRIEQNRTEQNRTEQKRIEHTRTEQTTSGISFDAICLNSKHNVMSSVTRITRRHQLRLHIILTTTTVTLCSRRLLGSAAVMDDLDNKQQNPNYSHMLTTLNPCPGS